MIPLLKDSTRIVDPRRLPYRLCVGLAVFNDIGKVWIGQRCLNKYDDVTRLWQLPQGGIRKTEKPIEAAYRELWEETGICSVKLIGESDEWIYYDLPTELVGVALCGKYRGQKQKWFAMRFTGHDSEITINPPPDGNVAEFDDWAWTALEDIPRMVVAFKQPVYARVVMQFLPIVSS
ncbi:MAG: putative (di)nucleoside polyphosphate hydrolase [Candidatus Tokpelaia sp. JSC085]|nr:MAG: putative (di)nucleoside polyphosphate hydrolase [Candidatus Tokpelaia sp. JSC085]